eukprot:g3727.t1
MEKHKLLIILIQICLSVSMSSIYAKQMKAKVISIELPNGKRVEISRAPKQNQYDRTSIKSRQQERDLRGSKGSPAPSPPPSPSPSPVNCAGSWSSWSACSGGTQSRTYTVTTQPSNGGTACPSSPESRSCTAPVNCAGSWSSWSACSGGTKSRTYTVTTQPSNGGTACPSSPESRSCTAPVNCAGSWSSWSACSGGTKSRTYTVTTQPSNGGTACPSSPESQSCALATTTLSPQTTTVGASAQGLMQTSKIAISWDYMVPAGAKWFNVSEMPLVHCEIGQTVDISWSNTSIQHDIYELYSYPSYIDCDFSKGQKRMDAGRSGNYSFTCDTMGTKFFSCNVGAACATGKQRIRVHGIDSRKTSALSQAGASTLAGYMKASITVYKGDTTAIPENDANGLEQMLLSIASNSPLSCSDWLIPSHLSNATCLGYVFTDLGVLYRQRASKDLEKAKNYYDKALQLIPDFCLAESYLVELQMQKNDKSAADAQFEIACKACGKSDLDIEIIRMAYKAKGWALPTTSNCNPLKQNVVVNGDDSGARSSKNETDLLSTGSSMLSQVPFVWFCGVILISIIML